MIVAATAAMAGAVFADAQVYDMQLTVKTTQCKQAKISKAIADLGWFNVAANDVVAFRMSATRKVAGVIWGCTCDTISVPAWRAFKGSVKTKNGVSGYMFWDQTTSPYTVFQIPYTTFKWVVLNRVGKSLANVEGTWVLGDQAAGESFFFVGGGFGTCTALKKYANDCDGAYVKAMSGSFGGFSESVQYEDVSCVFCGDASGCLVLPFCMCDPASTKTLTACYGTWQLKYNTTQSKRLLSKTFITEVRNFKGEKVANLGVAADAAKEATIAVYKAEKKLDVSEEEAKLILQSAAAAKASTYTKIARGDGSTFVKPGELKDPAKGNYYGRLAKAASSYKNADVALLEDPGKVDEKEAYPEVAQVLLDMLDHVEGAAQKQEEDWGGDDWGDDDWGDDDWGDDF